MPLRKKLFFQYSFSWFRPSLALAFSVCELPRAEAKPNSPEPVQPPLSVALLAAGAPASCAFATPAKASRHTAAIRVLFIGRSMDGEGRKAATLMRRIELAVNAHRCVRTPRRPDRPRGRCGRAARARPRRRAVRWYGRAGN